MNALYRWAFILPVVASAAVGAAVGLDATSWAVGMLVGNVSLAMLQVGEALADRDDRRRRRGEP